VVIIVGRRSDTKVLKMKSCPKCKSGDIAIDRDHHGWYEYCIQCGYAHDLISVVEPEEPAGGRKKGRRKSKTLSKGE
jgi:Zn ribbon nucleic-acid-binding protein